MITRTTKPTPTTTRPTMSKPILRGGSSSAKPMQKGGSSAVKPMQKGGSSCNKPMQQGGSKKHSGKKTKKAKKSKKPMPKGFAYCLMCSKQTEMLNPETRTTKNGRKQMVVKVNVDIKYIDLSKY